MANIEGGAYVEINDKSENHFHTIIGDVYGGNDVSGTIGISEFRNSAGETSTSNTYVRVTETVDAVMLAVRYLQPTRIFLWQE